MNWKNLLEEYPNRPSESLIDEAQDVHDQFAIRKKKKEKKRSGGTIDEV